jgi:hypothetical protein
VSRALRLVRVVKIVCGLGLAVSGALFLVGLPGDIPTWYRCIRYQQCPESFALSWPLFDDRTLWNAAVLLLGLALLLPDSLWRSIGRVFVRQDPRALQILFDPAANGLTDEAGRVVAYTVAIHNARRRRVTGLTVMLTAWFIGGSPKESDKVILSSLRRRCLIPRPTERAQAEYSLDRDTTLEFQVASLQRDGRYVFTFADVDQPETGKKGKPAITILPVPAGQYRVLVRAQGKGTLPVDRHFLLTLQHDEIAMVSADQGR